MAFHVHCMYSAPLERILKKKFFSFFTTKKKYIFTYLNYKQIKMTLRDRETCKQQTTNKQVKYIIIFCL